MSRRGQHTTSCFIFIPGKTSLYVLEGMVHYFMLHHYSRSDFMICLRVDGTLLHALSLFQVRLQFMSQGGRYTTSCFSIIPGKTSLYVLEGMVHFFMLHHYSRSDFNLCLRVDGTLLHASALFQVRLHYMSWRGRYTTSCFIIISGKSRKGWFTTSCFITIPGKTSLYVLAGMVHYVMLNPYSR